MSLIDPKTLTQTCSACPSQWEGTLEDGRMVYIRYRWGHLDVSVSKFATENVYDAVSGELLLDYFSGDDWDGFMTLAQLNSILAKNGLSKDPEFLTEEIN